MATLSLRQWEMQERRLPPVCMRCGTPTKEWVSATLRCCPRWVFLFWIIPPLFMILRALSTRETTITAPMCRRDNLHWARLVLMRTATFLGFIAGPVAIVASTMLSKDRDGNPNFDVFIVAAILWGVGMAIWMTACAVLQFRSIRAIRIDQGETTLVGVSNRFVEALEGERADPAEREQPGSVTIVRGDASERPQTSVVLELRDATQGRLPPVCMRCGEEAVAWVLQAFVWSAPAEPGQRGSEPQKGALVRAPMCDRHRRHWSRIRRFRFGVFAAAIVWTGFLLAANDHIPWLQQRLYPGALTNAVGCWFVAMVVWYVLDLMARGSAIRMVHLNDRYITFDGVSQGFIAALREWHATPEQEVSDRNAERPNESDDRIRR